MKARGAIAARLADVPVVPDRSGVRALLDSAEAVAARVGGVAVVDAELVRTAEEWAQVIKADLSSAVEGIVAAGVHLARAKADVRHGEWLPMLKQIGISQSAAKRLMSIAANPAISNRPTLGDLPSSIVALAELSRLPADEIESGIADGSITSDMTITKAKALVDPTPEPVAAEPVPEGPPTEQVPGTCRGCGCVLAEDRDYEYQCDTCVEAWRNKGIPDAEATGERRCVECGNWFPLDMLVSPPTVNSAGGYDYVCQECGTDESVAYVPPVAPETASERRCVDCGNGSKIWAKTDNGWQCNTCWNSDRVPTPAAPQKNRQPLALQAQNAGLDLQRAIRRIERLFNDANNAQRKKLAPELTSLLNNAITNCQLTIQHIEHPGEVFIDTVEAES